MEVSMFNVWADRRDGMLILFNSFTGALAIFKQQYRDKMQQALTTKNPALMPVEFRADLLEDGYLVQSTQMEIEAINRLVSRRNEWVNEYFFSVVLNLTCNFSCFYCFEKHTGEHLKEETERRFLNMAHTLQGRIKKLSVDWYGGEPLLSFARLRKMNDYLIEICTRGDVVYDFSITTNGYLLNQEVRNYLRGSPLTFIQITLDGPPQTHNKNRPLKDGSPTFQIIFHNIQEAVAAGLEVVVRVNLTTNNVDKILMLYDIVKKAGLKNKIQLMLKPVVSSPANPCGHLCLTKGRLGLKMTEIYRQAAEDGWIVFPNIDKLQCMGFCIAEYPNHFILDPRGQLYKCGELFDKNEQIGILGDHGEIRITNRGEYDKWVNKNPLSFPECRNCAILPICMGGCNMKRFRYGTDCCEELKHDLSGFLEVLVLNQKNINQIKNAKIF